MIRNNHCPITAIFPCRPLPGGCYDKEEEKKMLTLDKIYHAAFVLKNVARKTDLIKATKLSDKCQLYLKTENLQETGSFKLRGAYYKISQLTDEEKSRGIIACSAGNHAQGVAMAASHNGIKAVILSLIHI